MAYKSPFHHSGILTSALGAANASGLFSPSTTASTPADIAAAADTAGSAVGDTTAQRFLQQNPNAINGMAAPKYGYDGHPVMAALDYILNGGRGHAAASQAQYGLQSSAYLQQLQQQGALQNRLAEMQAALDQNPILLKQQNDATQALAAAQRSGADNRLQATLDRLQQYNFSGNANGAAPLRSTRENPYTTATDLDTLYGQPEINSIGLNRSRALGESADNSSIASLATRPYIPSIATSQAGADIFGNMFKADTSRYGSMTTAAKMPNAANEAVSQQNAAIAGNNLDTTKNSQTTAFLENNPTFTGNALQTGQNELAARIAAMSRSVLNPGALEVAWNPKNQATGSVLNPAPINPMLGGQFAPQYRALQTTGTATPTFSVDEVNKYVNASGTNSAPNPYVPTPVATALDMPAASPMQQQAATTANQSPQSSPIDFNSPALQPYIDPQTGQYVGPQRVAPSTPSLKQSFNKWLLMNGLR